LAITGVSIIGAPAAFAYPLPFDASSYILPTAVIEVLITGLPAGDYVLQITDVCGNLYPLSVTVPQIISTAIPTVGFLKGCTDGFGSMYIDTPNRRFSQVIITNAPSGFNHALPYDVSFNISPQGKFYMNNLPEGTYSFHTLDVCGIANDFQTFRPGLSRYSKHSHYCGELRFF